jgi:hypothetical protein
MVERQERTYHPVQSGNRPEIVRKSSGFRPGFVRFSPGKMITVIPIEEAPDKQPCLIRPNHNLMREEKKCLSII